MKKYITFVLFISLFIGCKEQGNSKKLNAENPKGIVDETSNDPKINPSEDAEAVEVETEELNENSENTIKTKDFTGSYQRMDDDKTDLDCDCNCLNINLAQTQTLCIDKESNINIEVKFKEGKESDIAVYFVSGSGNMEGQKDIPWEDFDKNSVLATIDFSSPDSFDLDWKGFTQNGEIAIDYAVLGKKNLEGKYKRK